MAIVSLFDGKRIVAIGSAALFLGGLGPIQMQTVSPSALYSNNDVRRLIVLDKMRGHLAVSILDWDMAQYDSATEQIADIQTELYSIVANDLKTANLQDSFLTAANDYAQVTTQAGDKTKVHAAYDALVGVIHDASNAFAPAAAFSDTTFRLKVAQGLLGGAAEEYSEGVSGGRVVKLIGYQNAVGFLQIAEENYMAAQKAIQTQYPELDKTVSVQYAILTQAMTPDLATPAKPAEPQLLTAAIDAIQNAEEQALGIKIVTERSVSEILAASRAGLNDALDEYSTGNVDNAYELAAGAYLDNYEGLEVPLRAKDAALTDLLEQQFNQFDKLIKAAAKIDDLKALYAQIVANLDKAQSLFSASR